jgi:parallel beta-helix repeat protein
MLNSSKQQYSFRLSPKNAFAKIILGFIDLMTKKHRFKFNKNWNFLKIAIITTFVTIVLPFYFQLDSSFSRAQAATPGITYYVDASIGNDNNSGTTETSPLKTISKATEKVTPGDTVLVKNGTYNEPYGVNMRTSGSSSAWITFKAYPNHKPFVTSSQWYTFCIDQKSYIEINGFEITNTPQTPTDTKDGAGDGILTKNNSHHIRLLNNKIHGAGGGGIATVSADYITIEGNIIYDNTKRSNLGQSAISLYELYNYDTASGYHNFIRKNFIYDNENLRPFKYYGDGTEITDGNGIIIDDSKNTQNPSTNPHYLQAYNGSTLIENNIIFDNGGRGIHVFLSDNVIAVNNTLYQNNTTSTISGELTALSSGNVKFYNNSVYARAGKLANAINSISLNIIFSYNIYYNYTGTLILGSNDKTADPKYINPSFDPAVANFHLQSTSPAINTGTSTSAPTTDFDGKARPSGAGYDRGAYEY